MRATDYPLTLRSHECPLCGCYKSYTQLICGHHNAWIVYEAQARSLLDAHERRLQRPAPPVDEPTNIVRFPIERAVLRNCGKSVGV